MKTNMPLIMVAPNGARKNKEDHPNLPISISEIVECAKSCFVAGADNIHAHVRDKNGMHVLDAGLYLELIKELEQKTPTLNVQITTEAVGQYSPNEQRSLVKKVMPKAVSVALKEMLSDDDEIAQRRFYWWASEQHIDLQHIIYSPDEVLLLANLIAKGFIPSNNLSMLFVLGRYVKNQISSPADLVPFLKAYKKSGLNKNSKFMICAFGQNEQACLLAAAKAGGDCRIGFENNHLLPDGTLARDNAGQVGALVVALPKPKC